MRYNHSDIKKKGDEKMNITKEIKSIEEDITFKGEDLELMECLENGYLFTYQGDIFQVFYRENKGYTFAWTCGPIGYDEWMKPALDDAGISEEEFESMIDLDKASTITRYFGFLELTGLEYTPDITLEEVITEIKKHKKEMKK